eukprot:Skav215850  [mRNA]  locus=scaffold1630:187679:188899:- [translate_table: standard]
MLLKGRAPGPLSTRATRAVTTAETDGTQRGSPQGHTPPLWKIGTAGAARFRIIGPKSLDIRNDYHPGGLVVLIQWRSMAGEAIHGF